MKTRRSFHNPWLAAIAAAAAFGCADSDGPRKISHTQEAKVAPGSYEIGVSSRDRFEGKPARKPASNRELVYDVPPGWIELPPTQLRQANFRPAGSPDAECYMTTGLSGGIVANVNRWRGQFGLVEIDAAAVGALPTQELYGTDATLVELEGVYQGMAGPAGGGAAPRSGFALVGLILSMGDQLVSVKMTGPKELLAAERANFDLFVKSVRGVPAGGMPSPGGALSDPHGAEMLDPHGDPHGAAIPPSSSHATLPPGGLDAVGIRFTAPAGWTRDVDRPTRLATLKPAGTSSTECSIIAMPGDAGGVAANLARWRGQMGLIALSASEIAALQKVKMLGVEGVVVDWSGSFNDDMTRRSIPQARFCGAIAMLAGRTVFVKLTGPAAEVDDKVRDGFLELCSSLTE